MPKSKRAQVVHLTATKKKTKDHRVALIQKVATLAQESDFAYIIRIQNPRVVFLQNVRHQVPGKLIMGKARLMRKGLGEDPQSEVSPGLSELANNLKGGEALLFSTTGPDALRNIFAQFRQSEFARAGSIATETIELDEGELEGFVHTQEPALRKLGLPTRLYDGKIYLMGRTTVCTAGQPLTVEAAQLIKLLGCRMAEFSVEIGAVWTRATSKVKQQ